MEGRGFHPNKMKTLVGHTSGLTGYLAAEEGEMWIIRDTIDKNKFYTVPSEDCYIIEGVAGRKTDDTPKPKQQDERI